MTIKNTRKQNVGAIKNGSVILQGIVEITASGQISITPTDTDDLQKLEIVLADPINANIVSPVDASTSAINVMQYNHHEIHAGMRYHYSDVQTLADTATMEYLIETPAGTEEQHLVWSIKGSTITEVHAFKDSTRVGDSDVTAEVFNHNFRSVSTANITLDDSITGAGADGTLFYNDKGGSAQGNFKAGNDTSERDEWVLEASKKYLFRITSGAASNIVTTHFDFYQHTPDA